MRAAPSRKQLLVLLPWAVLAVGAAACGSSNSQSATTASTASATTGMSAGGGMAYATAQIAKYRSEPTWKPPGPPFDAKKAAGKTVYDTPTASANAFVKAFTDAQGEAAKLVGVKYTVCANNGTVTEWAKCQTQGISQRPDVLLLGGPDPAQLAPQLKAAAQANVPVVSAALYDPGMPRVPGVAAWTFEPYQLGARLMADWVIKETGGKANVLIVTANELAPSKYMTKAIADELSKHCGDACQSTEINVALPDWPTKMQGAVQSALVKDPSLNYVIPIYDPMLPFVVAAIRAAGRSDQVHATSYNGTASALKMIQDGDIVSMIVGQDLTCVGYSDMDPVFRILAGEKPVDNLNRGLRIWDDSNISEAGTPPNQTQGYGDACTGGFKKLWGLG